MINDQVSSDPDEKKAKRCIDETFAPARLKSSLAASRSAETQHAQPCALLRERISLKLPNTQVGLTSDENACSFRGQGAPREEILLEDSAGRHVRDIRATLALRATPCTLCALTSHIPAWAERF